MCFQTTVTKFDLFGPQTSRTKFNNLVMRSEVQNHGFPAIYKEQQQRQDNINYPNC